MAKEKKTPKNVDAPFETTAEITKVVRTEKPKATVTLEIPVKDSSTIPIGRVTLTIEKVQAELDFDPSESEDDEVEDEDES